METPALECRSVSWGPPSGPEVVRNVSLRCHAGTLTNLVGHSGGGKSTLLRLCARLAEPGSGTVLVSGRPVADWDIQQLRRKVVYVPQRTCTFADTLAEDLVTPVRWRGETRTAEQLREALDIASLSALPLDCDIRRLSEGQLARANIARALLLQPEILLLDEPTASLDPDTAQAMLEQLDRWATGTGCTRLTVTHRLDELAAASADTLVLIDATVHGPYTIDQLRDGELPSVVCNFVKRIRKRG